MKHLKNRKEILNEDHNISNLKEKYNGFDTYLKDNVLEKKYGLSDGNTSIGSALNINGPYGTTSDPETKKYWEIQYKINPWFPEPIKRGNGAEYERYLNKIKETLDILTRIKADFGSYKYWSNDNEYFIFEIKGENFENSNIVKEYFNEFRSQKGIDKYNL